MGDPASPQAPVNPAAISSLPMLYYGLVVVGTAAIVLVLYNLLIVKFCIEFTDQGSRQGAGAGAGPARRPGTISSWRFRNPNTYAVSSFKYKKEGGGEQDEGGDSECAVCLSAFEEGEELRQMPRCKHSFHAPCIDMWLYSHMDCPLCRSPVTQPRLQQSEHSQVLLGTGNLVSNSYNHRRGIEKQYFCP